MDSQNNPSKKSRFSMPALLTVSANPHIKSAENTQTIMLTVIIAMLPALVWSVYIYGLRALVVVLMCTGLCVLTELLYQKAMKQRITVGDLSAAVTGMLFGFNMPASIPYWMAAVGCVFAIIVVKQLFGGIGKNFLNPALAARAFLFAWPTEMTTYYAPHTHLPVLGASGTDAVASATALASLKSGELPTPTVMDAFFGKTAGCIGEISALLILCGGIFLLIRRVITWHIPVAYLGTVALITYLFPRNASLDVNFMWYSLFSGGLFLGAFFMATDYTTSPLTPVGKLLYGVGCGGITVFIRYFGGLPEGVTFAILVMNLLVWYIDRLTRPRPFGKSGRKKDKRLKEAK